MLRKGAHKKEEFFGTQHRFEHWYRDNSLYFITARCRHQTQAFESIECREIFWDRFAHYAQGYDFVPIIVSLLTNHYHLLAYLRAGTNLGPFMQKFHGSVAKMVNDHRGVRLTPFWTDSGHRNYFDGCLRDEKQLRRTYRYVLTQCSRHLICADPADYPDTVVYHELGPVIRRAHQLKTFLEDVPYKRYDRRRRLNDQ